MDMIRLAAIKITSGDLGLPNSTKTLSDAITNTVKLLTGVIGALSVIAIIAGGIMITSSQGDPGRYARGKNAILYAVIGLVLALSAYAIVAFISGRFI